MTFGSGIHFCMGAALARAELQEALPLLARRMPDLARSGEVEWKPSTFGIWGPARLHCASSRPRTRELSDSGLWVTRVAGSPGDGDVVAAKL